MNLAEGEIEEEELSLEPDLISEPEFEDEVFHHLLQELGEAE